jgi:hypothetical protein
MNYYALFHGERQITKAHGSKETVMVEAHEQGLVFQCHGRKFLLDGYEIRPCTPK